ncbi:hypothetical protein L1987_50313 [Smallanthus sonchifolius]|uniref:Uncharacterized protein n=1 Tax=Smallanthus sonchifolius TaxID=185202 RepID=A0ACB9EN91_9ASTR|nr:hypothetical protein L1987_50313 [Smallanthus sonchifolius]
MDEQFLISYFGVLMSLWFRFSKPLLTPTDDTEEIFARRDERLQVALERITKYQNYCDSDLQNPIARWDTNFQTGAKTALLLPFSPIVVAADDGECIRVWNYEEAALLNSFSNHEYPDKGISKLCLMNELDNSLLLVASSYGNVRVWKDYTIRCKQKLVTAFSSIHGGRGVSAVVDWQQQSGYMYASGGISSTMVWDLNKEQLLSSIPLASDCSISALLDLGTVLSDCLILTPEGVEKVVGIGFQPGLYPAKIVSASQAGDIQCLDIRNPSEAYLTIDAHRGSLTALAIHRHAQLIASCSAKQLIKVFNTEGEHLGTIRYTPNFMAQKVGSTTSLAFNPYQILLAAGSTDARVSIYADEISGPHSGPNSVPEFHTVAYR